MNEKQLIVTLFILLTGNHMKDEGATMISQALKINTTLTSLDISGNK